MTREVHAYRNLTHPLPVKRSVVTRYECQGCGASYAEEDAASGCEIHHQAIHNTKNGEPLVPVDTTLDLRGARYGMFIGVGRIAEALNAVVTLAPNWDRLDADQKEAMRMIQNKTARILNGDPNYADSWHDIAGYATLIADRLKGNLR